jgi:D-proline reductase (dithiol) PrdB
LCHQTVGLIARGIEEAGIPTVTVSSCRDITQSVKPPRTVFVDFPLGHSTGSPFDKDQQTYIVKEALSAIEGISEPGSIIDLSVEWHEAGWEENVLRKS